MKLPESYVVSKLYQYCKRPNYSKYKKVYNAECPICNEGNSSGRKKRFFYFPDKDNVYCHNCGYSTSTVNWIIEQSKMNFADVIREAGSYESNNDIVFNDSKDIKKQSSTLPDDSINLFDKQQLEFYNDNQIVQDALDYIKHRRLDIAVNRPKALYISLKDFIHKNRLCIPFYNESGKITFYQTRAIYKEDEIDRPKYLSKLNSDKGIYGISNIDTSLDHIFIFEGPIDSFFVKNGVGMCGVKMSEYQESLLSKYRLMNKIWVLDNQHIDKTSKEKSIELLDKGHSLFIWPKGLEQFKDFADICNYKQCNEISHAFIMKHVCSGIECLMKLRSII